MSVPKINVHLLADLVTWAAQDAVHHGEVEPSSSGVLGMSALEERFAEWGRWDQAHWGREARNGACETAYCIAGQAVTQAGFGLVYNAFADDEDDQGRSVFTASYCAPRVADGVDDKGNLKFRVSDDQSQQVSVETKGREVLGLDNMEGAVMFAGNNTIGQVIGIAEWLAFRHDQRLTFRYRVPYEVLELADYEGTERLLREYSHHFLPACAQCGQRADMWSQAVQLKDPDAAAV